MKIIATVIIPALALGGPMTAGANVHYGEYPVFERTIALVGDQKTYFDWYSGCSPPWRTDTRVFGISVKGSEDGGLTVSITDLPAPWRKCSYGNWTFGEFTIKDADSFPAGTFGGDGSLAATMWGQMPTCSLDGLPNMAAFASSNRDGTRPPGVYTEKITVVIPQLGSTDCKFVTATGVTSI